MSPRIQTCGWAKPIPDRRHDWSAWYDDDEPNDDGWMAVGEGPTEQEAILDLIENYPRPGIKTEREAGTVLAFVAASLVVAMVAVICGILA